MKKILRNIELFGDMFTGMFLLMLLIDLTDSYHKYPDTDCTRYVIVILGFIAGYLYYEIKKPIKLALFTITVIIYICIHYASWGFFISFLCGQHLYLKAVKSYEQ